jgi:AcrR family transcriptional regulator
VENDDVTMEHSGGGDPKRSIELLWGVQEKPRRGPKPKLTVEQIVRAATRVADAEGLAALSMRRVADELDVAVMSLYTYFPSKAELIDVMLDRALGETARPGGVPHGWRGALEQVARENWALLHRHPWLLQVATGRPPLGPNVTAKYDYELRAVDGIGLTDVEMDAVLSLVLGHVEGAARRSVEAARAVRSSGMTDEEWWTEYAPLLEQVLDPSRYPVAARVGQAAGEAYGAAYDPNHGFEFGLARLLDGVEALVRSRVE